MPKSSMIHIYSQYSKCINFEGLQDPSDIWELGPMIGEGTYGEVYEGFHKRTGQKVAIKVMESVHEVIEEIEEEFLVLRDLGNHPNIPTFYGLYLKVDPNAEDQVWLVMELCNGGSVTDMTKYLIKHGEKMQEALIAHVLKETLKALKLLHDNCVMHRDIKGHNILLSTNGEIKLVDFGVSGHLDHKLDHRQTSVGTPYWMAPEVIACEQQVEYNYDVRCDVWSLGITAIELADGEPPHAEQHPMRALFKIPRSPSPSVKQPQKWTETFKDFIACCLRKDIDRRPFCGELMRHPFIDQAPDDTTQIKKKLKGLIIEMERVIHEPDVTTKRGRLKSRRKSKRELLPPIIDDLAMMEILDEKSIVDQLFARYLQSSIYTYIGDILLAVNPFTPLTIYTEEYSKMYSNAAKGDNPPHIYAVADQSYQMMMHNKLNQCIVISGESGAGKTESANFLVQQLTQLGKAPNRILEDQILQVNPLMEAFGNAKTVINDNSSRFGKYLEMIFTDTGKVIGAQITEYLLEKSRVIHQARSEQNFHIFYYIHDGLSGEKQFHLNKKNSYRYLDAYKGLDATSVSLNRTKFKAIQHCFDIIGFNPEDVTAVYNILASIMHLGNIKFSEEDIGCAGDACTISNIKLAELVSKLLRVESKDLVEALTTTGMVMRGEIIIRNNSRLESVNARDGMAKALYGRLFSWIVNKINVLLQPHAVHLNMDNLTIGLLDIFGFENFAKNSFEQLCINIANEQLQYYFNQHIFAWEMQEYKNEGIDGSQITFVDNRPILDMFLMKPMGLLSLLDEESNFPKATDQTLVDKFHQNIRSRHYKRPKASNLLFTIDHYAGMVEYNTFGFLEKNRDRLPIEINNLLRTSDILLVQTLFKNALTKTGNLADCSSGSSKGTSSHNSTSPSPVGSGTNPNLFTYTSSKNSSGSGRHSKSSVSKVQQTVATYFRYSLMDLLAKMVAGSPHFVRCLKPNDDKLPGNFNSDKVTVQLRYTGVLETTRIRRQGYSHRILFQEFIRRYYLLAFKWNELPGISSQNCRLLLARLELRDWAIGKTKVFLKYYHVEKLARKFEQYNKKVVLAQSVVRMWLGQRRYDKMRWKREKACLLLQRCIRGWRARRIFGALIKSRRWAAIIIQKRFRGHSTRRKYHPIIVQRRTAAVAIQSSFRGYSIRKSIKEQRSHETDCAVIIQKSWRKYQAKRIVRHLQKSLKDRREHAALVIQTIFRMWRCQTVYRQLLRYKADKELQLIYFGQQVENYSKNMRSALMKTNQSIDLYESKTDVIVNPPSPQQIDLSEDRLSHMVKMKETKSVLGQNERSYYDAMQSSSMVMTSTKKGEVKQVMTEKDRSYYDQIVKEARRRPTATKLNDIKDSDWDAPLQAARDKALSSSDEEQQQQKHRRKVSPEAEHSYEKVSKTHESKSREILAKTIARALLANKPTDPNNEPVKSDSLPWDAPIENAKQQTIGTNHEPALPVSEPKHKKRQKSQVPKSDYGSQTDSEITGLRLSPIKQLGGNLSSYLISQEQLASRNISANRNGVTIIEVTRPRIQDDFKTDRVGLQDEYSTRELAHQLERERAKSASTHRQTKPSLDHTDANATKIILDQSDYTETPWQFVTDRLMNLSSTMDYVDLGSEKYSRKNRLLSPKDTSSTLSRYGSDMDGNNNHNSHRSDENENESGQFNFRSFLRRTNIDLKKTLRKSDDIQPPEQIDFRHVLKRRGRGAAVVSVE